jgi:hypothetical protein
MQECCKSLADAQEVASDVWIQQIVKIHQLSNRISDAFCYGNIEDSEFRGHGVLSQMTKAFEHELQSVRTIVNMDATGNGEYILMVWEIPS